MGLGDITEILGDDFESDGAFEERTIEKYGDSAESMGSWWKKFKKQFRRKRKSAIPSMYRSYVKKAPNAASIMNEIKSKMNTGAVSKDLIDRYAAAKTGSTSGPAFDRQVSYVKAALSRKGVRIAGWY